MKSSIKIAITAGGAPQSATLIRYLKNNPDGVDVKIVSLDMNREVYGYFFGDSFYQIPPAGSERYRDEILKIIEKERPDAFVNSSGADVPHISRMKDDIEKFGTTVLVSSPETIEEADNKFKLFSAFKNISGVDVPEYVNVKSLDDFIYFAKEMGYPKRDLCFKPHVSKGSRGFRILTERFDRKDLLLNHKPEARYLSLTEFQEIFQNSEDFTQLLLMEVVDGEECDVMTIAHKGEALLTTVKSRESHRWGIIDRGELIDRPELVQSTAKIIERIPLAYNISIQFIGGKLIEINPRTSTFIFTSEFNEPWLAVKLALGMCTSDNVREYQRKIPFGHRMIRYMDQIFF